MMKSRVVREFKSLEEAGSDAFSILRLAQKLVIGWQQSSSISLKHLLDMDLGRFLIKSDWSF